MSSVFWCSSCLTMSTRNRITFDKKGRCNACQWAERKKTLDWSIRKTQLEDLLDKNRSSNKDFDCLVPVLLLKPNLKFAPTEMFLACS